MVEWEFRYAGVIKADIANGLGVGLTFFTQGCSHKCPFCQNPGTWDYNGGRVFTNEVYNDIINYVGGNLYINHITLSGGEPFENIELCKLIVDGCRKVRPDILVWCYTGYTYEEIANNPLMNELLQDIDILVDGLFVNELRDVSLAFRGSPNQRIIDVNKSLKNNHATLYDRVKQ